MKSKVKLLTVTLAIVAVASLVLYTPLTNALQSREGQECDVRIFHIVRPRKALLWRWFLNHSEPVELEGTAVALFRDMLIVNTAEGQIQIHLPKAWTVDEELTMREELFESGYLSVGENITVKALRANVIDKEGLCVYLLLGYEIIDESTVRAIGVLPFNIET